MDTIAKCMVVEGWIERAIILSIAFSATNEGDRINKKRVFFFS
jgi:hypothetical protein